MKKWVKYSFYFLLSSQLMATSLTCENEYTTTISQSNKEPIVGSSDPDNGNVQLRIDITDVKNIYLSVGNQKIKLIYINKSNDNIMYFAEQTSNLNLNLYSLFPNKMLTVSKSYNFLGLANMNVQTVFKCR